LLCKKLVHEASEYTPLGDSQRTFRFPGKLRFSRRSCFVLSDDGLVFARQLQQRLDSDDSPPAEQSSAVAVRGAGSGPYWDAAQRELKIGDTVVKKFRVPAPIQEQILAAFEEENWTFRIDDPLPPRSLRNGNRF